MKVIVNLSEKTFTRISRLVENAEYDTVSRFLEVAAENQLALEDAPAGSGAEDQPDFLEPSAEANPTYHLSQAEDSIPIIDASPPPLVSSPWDLWVWGQINRIFPVKFAARLLALATIESDGFPSLDSFKVRASEEARSFGLRLERSDDRLGKIREARLSTGFPIGRKLDRSMLRYSSQFVGELRADGQLTGGLFQLKLAEVTIGTDGTPHIGLNPDGRRFAHVESPVLDKGLLEAALGEKERIWFLEHIERNVPGEAAAFAAILSLIHAGVDTRVDLNLKLSEVSRETGWSAGVVSTQRGGAIARMFELGLLGKSRSGQSVTYVVNPFGKEWMTSISSHGEWKPGDYEAILSGLVDGKDMR